MKRAPEHHIRGNWGNHNRRKADFDAGSGHRRSDCRNHSGDIMIKRLSSTYLRFVNLEHQPDPNKEVIAVYMAKRSAASRLDGLASLGSIAAEASSGTWVDV